MLHKYFGISLPRTGTSSLYYAMRILGFSSGHYFSERDYGAMTRDLQFTNDFPISLKYGELDKRFPGSRFIFPDRDVDAWLTSYEVHWRRTGHLTMGSWDKWNLEAFGTLTFDREVFRQRFLEHREKVFDYFRGRKDLLVLEMPYTDKTWAALCKFTNTIAPNVAFPKTNGSYSASNPWCPRSEVQHS